MGTNNSDSPLSAIMKGFSVGLGMASAKVLVDSVHDSVQSHADTTDAPDIDNVDLPGSDSSGLFF